MRIMVSFIDAIMLIADDPVYYLGMNFGKYSMLI